MALSTMKQTNKQTNKQNIGKDPDIIICFNFVNIEIYEWLTYINLSNIMFYFLWYIWKVY
jgi:hypothetical protein